MRQDGLSVSRFRGWVGLPELGLIGSTPALLGLFEDMKPLRARVWPAWAGATDRMSSEKPLKLTLQSSETSLLRLTGR